MRKVAGAALVLLGMTLAGCLTSSVPEGLDPDGAVQDALVPAAWADAGLSAAVGWAAPVRVSGEGHAYEPSIRLGPEGNLYAAAAAGVGPNVDARGMSWAWWSGDEGATWDALPFGPSDALAYLPGFEGDLAVDGVGRVYFADTHLVDDHLTRWSPGSDGTPQWEWTRPVVPTIDVLDDRPYMDAHGDGIVYLMSNNGADPPAWQNRLEDLTGLTTDGARIWIFASEDGGMTWSLGWGFPNEVFCAPRASRVDDTSVLVACYRGDGPGASMTVYRSLDRARTFDAVWATNYTVDPAFLTPWPAADDAGWWYAAWLDDLNTWSGLNTVHWAGNQSGHVMFARSPDGATWEKHDITPFPGRFGMNHVTAAGEGVVAVTFHATRDLEPTPESEWYGIAMVTADAHAADPVWHTTLLSNEPTAIGVDPPRDFFQNVVAPDGRVHVALQFEEPDTGLDRVFYIGQVLGPNLGVPGVAAAPVPARGR